MREPDRRFYRRWILANGWAESAGLGTTFVVGRALAPLLGSASGVPSVLTTAFAAVVLGTVLEGALVGVSQERVLRERVRVARWSWTSATTMGAFLAWSMGMMPSTILALTGSGSAAPAPAEPGIIVKVLLAAGLGIVAGPILGAAQWFVLRRLTPQPGDGCGPMRLRGRLVCRSYLRAWICCPGKEMSWVSCWAYTRCVSS
jgi:hypothetical protein